MLLLLILPIWTVLLAIVVGVCTAARLGDAAQRQPESVELSAAQALREWEQARTAPSIAAMSLSGDEARRIEIAA